MRKDSDGKHQTKVIYIILFHCQRKSVSQPKRIQLDRSDWKYADLLMESFSKAYEQCLDKHVRRMWVELLNTLFVGFENMKPAARMGHWRHTSLINWFSLCQPSVSTTRKHVFFSGIRRRSGFCEKRIETCGKCHISKYLLRVRCCTAWAACNSKQNLVERWKSYVVFVDRDTNPEILWKYEAMISLRFSY